VTEYAIVNKGLHRRDRLEHKLPEECVKLLASTCNLNVNIACRIVYKLPDMSPNRGAGNSSAV